MNPRDRSRIRRRTPLVVCLLLLAAALPLSAQFEDEDPVTLELVVPQASVGPGETVDVVLRVRVDEPWHIYSSDEDPDLVIPTAVEWQLPEGWKAGGLQQPRAHGFEFPGFERPVRVWEGEFELAASLTAPSTLAEESRTFRVKVTYQACDEKQCLFPQEVTLQGELSLIPGGSMLPPGEGAQTESAVGEPSAPELDRRFLTMLGLAFLGGLLLNIMPCVLPVLTLKLFGLVEQKELTAGARRVAGLAYTAGIVLCLWAFAVAVIIARALGEQVGWGFQFQSPPFVIGLATLVFVFSLNLFGLFELPALGTGAAARASRKEGWLGHLLTGAFVTLVATPCSAPFLGTGIGFAFTLPDWGIFLFFTAAALGLALPFLVIPFAPALLKLLPRPGPWLETFKRVMGFTLVATTVWLADTIAALTGREGLIGFLAFLTVVSLGAWLYGKWGGLAASRKRKLISLAVAVAFAVLGGKFFLVTELAEATAGANGAFQTSGLDFSDRIPWQPFSEENLALLRAERKPGFIDFTADW